MGMHLYADTGRTRKKIILYGLAVQMERLMLMVRRQMGKNFLQWLFSSPLIDGATEKGFLITVERARKILRECIHKGEPGHSGEPMWNRDNKLIKFIPGVEFTDPSYHLPHFYELFALWADEEDRMFWREAAGNSRVFLHLACNPDTGLSPEYAEYDGIPTQVRKLSLDVMTGITATHTDYGKYRPGCTLVPSGSVAERNCRKAAGILLCERKRQLGRSFSYRRDKT